MGKLIDLTGQTFGRLTVRGKGPWHASPSGGGQLYWLCDCQCGQETTVKGQALRTGATTSCGCYRRERLADGLHRGFTTHGHARKGHKSPTYESWRSMKTRCSQASHAKYHLYGGRGIRVTERWNSFEDFLADMGDRPAGTSLDRIDPDGHYEPGNCRWATPLEQRHNRSTPC